MVLYLSLLIPSMSFFVAVLAFNFVGNGLRGAAGPAMMV